MTTKNLKLRWAGTCGSCKVDLAAGTQVVWDSSAKTATCEPCAGDPAPGPTAAPAPAPPTPAPSPPAPAIDRGVAGASARRKYEKDRDRERRRKEAIVAKDAEWRNDVVERHPILGRVATVLTAKPVIGPESSKVKNWDKGALGEELVGPILDSCPGVVVLHDRRIPGSNANIDHLAVAPSGIYVIDPKNYEGAVERRAVGGWLNSEERLFVNGRNQTKLVDGVRWQMTEVRKVLGEEPTPIYGVLCFVGPNWRRFFTRPLHVQGIPVMWPSKVAELLETAGPMDEGRRTEVAARLSVLLPPA